MSEEAARTEYDAVDVKVGPVPLPMRAKRIRPVKVVARAVQRERDALALLADSRAAQRCDTQSMGRAPRPRRRQEDRAMNRDRVRHVQAATLALR